MKTNKQLAVLTVLCTTLLTACGSKTDPNEKNFGAAISQYLDKEGSLCLDIRRWPVDVGATDLRVKSQMAALEAIGLVKGEDAEVDIIGFMTNKPVGKAKVKRYTLTDSAKPFSEEQEVRTLGSFEKEKRTNLCWGKQALDKVVKWEGPLKLGDYQEASITYTYKVNNLADWAKNPEVQGAFPLVKRLLDGAGSDEQRRAVKLTSEGWEAKVFNR